MFFEDLLVISGLIYSNVKSPDAIRSIYTKARRSGIRTISGFHSILIHSKTLGGQLYAYYRCLPSHGSEQISLTIWTENLVQKQKLVIWVISRFEHFFHAIKIIPLLP